MMETMTVSRYRDQFCIPLEHAEQVEVIKHCDDKNIPIFSIPNGANKSMGQRMKFKAEGLRSGVPDTFIPVPRGIWHGLFIELKRLKGSKHDDNQKQWCELLTKQGYKVVIAYGHREAIGYIEAYLA